MTAIVTSSTQQLPAVSTLQPTADAGQYLTFMLGGEPTRWAF